MASKSKNPIWAFLASVKLALLLIALLASTSIIGTVIEQNKPTEHYVTQWGEGSAQIIQMLNLNDMYNSVWFLCLLGAFSLNLIVCSLDRIPTVVKIVHKDHLNTDPDRLPKMKFHAQEKIPGTLTSATEEVKKYLGKKGWKPGTRPQQYGTLFFSQKGAWTRYGVYVVHLSILVILLGAVIGSSTVATKILGDREFAFKGGISLPETAQSDFVFSYTDEEKIPLGFTVRCNFFDIDYYPGTGMPKDYLSGLTVIEDGKEVLTTTIEVNKPLIYKGITFYQSSYNQIGAAIIKLRETTSGNIHAFPVNPQNFSVTHQWKEGGSDAMIRIQSARPIHTPDGRESTEMQMWLMDSDGPPSMFTLMYGRPVIVERPKATYELSIGPHFATGLQVAKDPGVWWVYTGCALMLIGLYMAFFMSHRRIWAHVYEIDGQPVVVFAGHANKNSLGFAKTFSSLTENFTKRSS
ncbi:MAG: cytochrome c biogenesis protein ResB [Candidatus Electrothrix aestuarii]|uniref:Cytochrome c biogenesis protein ResB n=1 Tax=Candidatus Electrothrix aestuarii TaxID=3062594 RepID=A0AAU8LPT9_9BACT|nr:cytochrome c biogenesis protein ResB [Candidatus Electrothrix aestuarii]